MLTFAFSIPSGIWVQVHHTMSQWCGDKIKLNSLHHPYQCHTRKRMLPFTCQLITTSTLSRLLTAAPPPADWTDAPDCFLKAYKAWLWRTAESGTTGNKAFHEGPLCSGRNIKVTPARSDCADLNFFSTNLFAAVILSTIKVQLFQCGELGGGRWQAMRRACYKN